jgi:radical SAM superfamily enzyme YgiQ (UPF0313 family)
MKYKLKYKKRYLFRVIIPVYPTFNIYSYLADRTTALGPIYVATSAQELKAWDVEVIDENNLRRFGPVSPSHHGADHELLQKIRPADVVGFYGGLTSTIPRVYELAQFYKKKGIVTIAGGQHFGDETIPEALSSGIDFVVIGEGEETIKKLLSALREGDDLDSISGLAYKENREIVYTRKRKPMQDLDVLPLPDFSLLRYAKLEFFPVGRVRGCGMNCEFCTVKGRPRYASAKRLVEQVGKLVETMSARKFFIVDDLFGQDRDETIRLCRMLEEYQGYIGKHLKFSVQIRLDKAKDKEILKAMRNAGINTVAIGFESPIPEELKAMNKHLNPEDMLELAKTFHKFGFFIHGMFIFGYPMEEGITFRMNVEERIKYFKNFIKKARIDTIQVLLPVPIPNTELRTRLSRENRIYPLKDLSWEYYDGNFPLFKPDLPLTPEEMQIATQKIMGRFYHIRYLFMVLLNIFSIPHVPFYFNRIKLGWRRWYCKWRNYGFRLIGWRILKKWTSQLHKGTFFEKLEKAKHHLN